MKKARKKEIERIWKERRKNSLVFWNSNIRWPFSSRVWLGFESINQRVQWGNLWMPRKHITGKNIDLWASMHACNNEHVYSPNILFLFITFHTRRWMEKCHLSQFDVCLFIYFIFCILYILYAYIANLDTNLIDTYKNEHIEIQRMLQ